MSQNNPPLVKPPTPTTLDPAPLGPLAGNHNDDDGQAIEEYFEAPSHGPQEITGVEPQVDFLPTPTRILNVKAVLGAEPVQVLPADLNRMDCNVICKNAAFIVASEKSDCYYAPTIPANILLTLTGHTGAIWIYTETQADYGNVVTVNVVMK